MTNTATVSEILLRNVPEALRKAIRKIAIDEGVSMNGLIVDLIKAKVATSKKSPPLRTDAPK